MNVAGAKPGVGNTDLMKQIDINQDGKIGQDELFKFADKNKDGKLDQDELKQLAEAFQALMGGQPSAAEAGGASGGESGGGESGGGAAPAAQPPAPFSMDDLMAAIDENGDGKISGEEFKAVDKNNDGAISKSEFDSAVAKKSQGGQQAGSAKGGDKG